MSYVLTRRGNAGGWFLENIKNASKGLFTLDEEAEYLTKIAKFWHSSEGIKSLDK